MWMAPCAANNCNASVVSLASNESCSIKSNITNNQDNIYFINSYNFGLTLAVVTGFANALRYELLHYVKDVETATMNFWVTVGPLVICLAGVPFETFTLLTTTECIIYFLCVVLLLYSLLAPYSLKFIPPYVYSLIRSQQLVVLFFLQIICIGIFKPGIGNWIEYVGATLSILACIGMSLFKYLKK